MSLLRNHDLSAAFTHLITTTSVNTIMETQPAAWTPATWQRQWRLNPPLPHPEVLDELQHEHAAHGTIRRSFIFTYQDRFPAELFIAAMAWGFGNSGYGPARARALLTQPGAAETIETVVDAVRRDGPAAGFERYFSPGCRLTGLNTAFITKLLYFAGYEFPGFPKKQHPRPLIYDNRVASAITRLPEAPLMPAIWDKISNQAYERYCQWAGQTAQENGTEPVVVEYALFSLGDQVRQNLP